MVQGVSPVLGRLYGDRKAFLDGGLACELLQTERPEGLLHFGLVHGVFAGRNDAFIFHTAQIYTCTGGSVKMSIKKIGVLLFCAVLYILVLIRAFEQKGKNGYSRKTEDSIGGGQVRRVLLL
jgi:hypothetical protein